MQEGGARATKKLPFGSWFAIIVVNANQTPEEAVIIVIMPTVLTCCMKTILYTAVSLVNIDSPRHRSSLRLDKVKEAVPCRGRDSGR